MANVTGGDEQGYSRRGRASRFYQEQADPNWFQRFMGMGQSMASAVGLGGEQAPAGDPRITGNYDPTGANVTTGGSGRGSGGGGASRVTGGEAGGGGGRAPVTGTAQRQQPVDPSRNLLMDRNELLGGALSNRNLGRYATYGPIAATAVQSLMQDKPIEAAAGLAAGGGTAALVRSAGRTIGEMGPRGKLIGAGLQIAAPFLGLGAAQAAGGQAQSMYQRATGKGDPTQLSTQLGQTEKVFDLLSQMDERTARTYIETQRQLGRNAAELDLEILKRQQPIIEQAQRNALVRQQALVNTMGQNYAMLGTVATAGKLALGSQAEAGANLRTALQANPYSNAVLSAPSISF